MSDWPDIRPDDRVLLTSIPDINLVLALAGRLTEGILVGLGTMDEVAQARHAARSQPNVMFQPGSAEELPWQNGFFSVIIDGRCDWEWPERAVREIIRALTGGGTAYLKISNPQLPVENGCEEVSADGLFRVFRKPESAAEQSENQLRIL